jgi:UDPglucose 6-dehydrogenase
MKVGVIGCGFVGGAIVSGFKELGPKSFDKNPKLSKNTFNEVLAQDYIFICVPTPMDLSKGGQCDLSILESCIKEISDVGTRGVLIIKSTVPVGTTKRLQEEYPRLHFVHSPEFLTARNAEFDFKHPDRNIVGYTSNISDAEAVSELYRFRFQNTICLTMTSNESEMVKYIANCFLAAKVSFFNEVNAFSEAKGCDWHKVMSGVASDHRIGDSHSKIPGPDGDFGFGGTCFPKDINSLVHQMNELSLNTDILSSVWNTNLRVRKKQDWLSESSAVSNKK